MLLSIVKDENYSLEEEEKKLKEQLNKIVLSTFNKVKFYQSQDENNNYKIPNEIKDYVSIKDESELATTIYEKLAPKFK